MLTISNFLWATSTVRSRQWSLPRCFPSFSFLDLLLLIFFCCLILRMSHGCANRGLDVGGVHLSVLAPLADMVNHKQGARGGGFPLKDKDGELAFKLVSGANFSRGQEVRRTSTPTKPHSISLARTQLEESACVLRSVCVCACNCHRLELGWADIVAVWKQVLVSYGDKCNDMLFLEYGFGVPGNRLPCRWPDPRPLGAASAEQR